MAKVEKCVICNFEVVKDDSFDVSKKVYCNECAQQLIEQIPTLEIFDLDEIRRNSNDIRKKRLLQRINKYYIDKYLK